MRKDRKGKEFYAQNYEKVFAWAKDNLEFDTMIGKIERVYRNDFERNIK